MQSTKDLPCGITGTLMSRSSSSDEVAVVPMGKDCCPCFVVFLRILLVYLKTNSETMKAYHALRHKVKDCTEKARRQEAGYECVAEAVLREIPSIVREGDLRRVQALVRARAQRKKEASTNCKLDKDEVATPAACAKFELFERGPATSV